MLMLCPPTANDSLLPALADVLAAVVVTAVPGVNSGARVLTRLCNRRLDLLDQAGDRGQALVGSLDRLNAVRDPVQQTGQLRRTAVQALRREEIDRIVEGARNLLAGSKMVVGDSLLSGRYPEEPAGSNGRLR